MGRGPFYCAVIVGVCALDASPGARAQPAGDSWYVEQAGTVLIQRIIGSSAEAKAEPGSAILEVVGTFGHRGNDRPSLTVPEINVTIAADVKALTTSQRFPLLAVGLRGSDEKCHYDFPHTLVRGVTTQLEDAVGNGYELKKDKEADPAVVTWKKNPSRLCFAFNVPGGSTKAAALQLGQRTLALPLPAPVK